MKISVPTSWDDVTVAQYQALSQMNIEDYKNDLSYTVAVFRFFVIWIQWYNYQ